MVDVFLLLLIDNTHTHYTLQRINEKRSNSSMFEPRWPLNILFFVTIAKKYPAQC